MEFLTTTTFNIPLFIGAIAFLIFIHELGHFLAARLFNIEVEEFGIGFPPRMTKLFHAWGTDFTLNWLPLGGFVRPKGENDPSIPGGLAAAKPLHRIIVLLAGPFMNLFLASMLFAILFYQIGEPDINKVAILDIAKGSPAEKVGLEVGDIISHVNGIEINSTTKLQDAIYSELGNEIEIFILRDEKNIEFHITPRKSPPENEGAIGILMGNPRNPVLPSNAIKLGFVAVYRNAKAILELPGRIIAGTISPEFGRPVGYKGMYDIFSEIRDIDSSQPEGIPNSINTIGFFASISVSLGILNLLPIPALDGGRIIFVLPEILIRKRIPQNLENVVNFVSITLLLLLMIYINLYDFINPLELP